MRTHATEHVTVLLEETVEGLSLQPDAQVIDATLGRGGHATLILEKLGPKGKLLAIDADPAAVAAFTARASKSTPKSTPKDAAAKKAVIGNFRHIATLAAQEGIERADAIIADLGWRIEQFGGNTKEGGGKGFSFSATEPLLMTYGDPSTYPFTARDIVNEWKEEDITAVLKGYGEERFACRIAQAMVQARGAAPIETADQLAEIVRAAIPKRFQSRRLHPATKTFQALRIAVNDELDAVREFIAGSVSLLVSGGRLAIISFHSIEDRIVKHTLREHADRGLVKRITKKPITPSLEEIHTNPRARSAKLRIVEKI